MPSTSTLLSVVVLTITLMGVVAFAHAEQLIRYTYLQQLSEKIARTQEAVSVGVWHGKTTVVAEVRNVAGRGVLIKQLKFVIGCTVTYSVNNRTDTVVTSVVIPFYNIALKPFSSKYLPFDVRGAAIMNSGVPSDYVRDVAITYIATTVVTERNVFVFDPAPPANVVVLEIDRESIGKTFDVVLPNGKIARVAVYEYLFCGVGSPYRLSSYPDKVGEVTSVQVAYSPDYSSVREGLYVYGYDYDKMKFPDVSIRIISRKSMTLSSGENVNATVCSVYAPDYSLDGKTLTLSRGIMLVGTGFGSYDIAAVMFVKTPYPRYIDPTEIPNYRYGGLALEFVGYYVYENKVALPSNDVTVFEFLGPQAAYVSIAKNVTIMAVGNYYSQAVLIGVAVSGILSGSGNSIEVYAEFKEPYPIVVVIAPPRLW